MNDYLLTCRSLTYAQRTQRVLSNNGFKANVQRTPAEASREGCGFSVKLRGARLSDAMRVLSAASLMPRRVFSFENGRLGGEISV